MLLDTSFLLDVRHGDPEAIEKARELDAASEPQRVSVVSLFELYTGVVQSDATAVEADRTLEVVETKDVVPVERPVAVKAGRLHGELVNDGNCVDVRDCLIAATALTLEERVVTRNVDHFERFDGLSVERY